MSIKLYKQSKCQQPKNTNKGSGNAISSIKLQEMKSLYLIEREDQTILRSLRALEKELLEKGMTVGKTLSPKDKKEHFFSHPLELIPLIWLTKE